MASAKIVGEVSKLTEKLHVDIGERAVWLGDRMFEYRQDTEVLLQSVQNNLVECQMGSRELSASQALRLEKAIGEALGGQSSASRINGYVGDLDTDEDGYPLVPPGAVGLSFTHPESENLFVERRDLASVKYGKIAVFGIQKSGNTWVHGLLADTFSLPYLFSHTEVKTVGVLSSHISCGPRVLRRNDIVHPVCLVRDLRSIVVSFYHYMQSASYQNDIPYADYSDFETFYYDWFLSRVAPSLDLESYTENFAKHGVPILRYERLVNDTKGEMLRLFKRWSLAFDESALDAAIEKNSFSNLKAKGKQMGDVFIETSHFRKGGKSNFREELPERILRDINTRFEKVLLRWGYDV
ncbi:sulfotransferase domain-containing protein [Hyphomonas sp.]|uniref:sulfotransferase domain-containing protein n=1 Tax=Hyphomonas sp. TaxID=87 RepID=UPI0025B897BF|nr:sulfotransferase domain-containing protein [Hyphomonas sp.]